MDDYLIYKNKNLMILKNTVIIFICISIYTIFLSQLLSEDYKIICILPILYILGLAIMIITDPMFIYNLFKVIVLALYSIRMFILPLFIAIFGEFNYKSINNDLFLNIDKAVFIQCYEYLVVIIFISLYKKNNKIYKYKNIDILNDRNITKMIRNFIIFLSLAIGLIIIKYPLLLYKFRPIIFDNDYKYTQWSMYNFQVKNNIPTLIYYISSWGIIIIRILITYMLLMFIKKKSINSKIKNIYLIMSFLVISNLVLIVTEDRAGSIYALLSMLLLMIRIYPDKSKTIVKVILAVAAFIGIIVFIVIPFRESNQTFGEYINFKLNAYFSGTLNIAATFTMPRNNLIQYFIGDILRSIPIIKGFFTNMDMSYILFNKSLGYDPIYNSQIIPMIGQGYFYFGYIGAPIFSVILIYLGLKVYSKLKLIEDTFGYFTYVNLTIFLCLGVILYDFFLTFSLIIQYCFPMLLIHKIFIRKDKLRSKK